jgi:hypothetical protein
MISGIQGNSAMRTIEEIAKDLPEGSKVKVGRDIVWPLREGLSPSQKQIQELERALNEPEKLKGTVSVTRGKETLYKVQKGEVLRPWTEKLPEQASLFDKEISSPSSPILPREKQETVQSGFTAFSQKASTVEAVSPSWEEIPQDGKEPIQSINSGFKSFSQDANIIAAKGDISKENIAAVKLYDELLQQHPQSEGLDRSQLLLAPVESQMKADRQVLEMAFQNKMHSHTFDRILGQGSPRIENALAVTQSAEITGPIPKPTLSPALEYQVDLSREYYAKTQALVLEGQAEPKALGEGAIDIKAEVVSTRSDIDFEASPSPTSPVQSGVASAVASAKTSFNQIAADGKEKINKLQVVHNNLSKMSNRTKAESLKNWAQKQMPVVKAAAVKIATEKGPVVRDWAFKNYPDLAQAAQATVQAGRDTRQMVHDVQQDPKGMAAKGILRAGGILKDLGMKAATAADHAVKHIPAAEIEKIEHAVREAITVGSQGKADRYSTGKFNFQVSEDNKVNVTLNNAEKTPVLSGGKMNYDIGWKDLASIQKLPETMNQIRQDINQQKTAHQYREQMMEV